jgi:hypothetical protein
MPLTEIFRITYLSHLQSSGTQKEIRLYRYGILTGKSMGGDKISGAWCQLIGLVHVVGSEGGVIVIRAALKRDVP